MNNSHLQVVVSGDFTPLTDFVEEMVQKYEELVTTLKKRREELGLTVEDVAIMLDCTAEEILAVEEMRGPVGMIFFLMYSLCLGYEVDVVPNKPPVLLLIDSSGSA